MTERSDITLSLDAVRGEVSKFDRIGAGLADLEREHPKDVVYPVATADGMEQAIVARRAWREPRIALEHARKAAKAPVLDLGRKIDAFAGDLEKKLREGEDHYDSQIKAEEGRKEAERQRRLQIEAEKIAAIRRRIAEVFAAPMPPGVRPSAADMRAMRERLAAEPVDDSFGDLKIEAQETKVVMLQALDEKIAEQQAFEDQQAEVARQRAVFLEEQRQETARRAAERKEEDERLAAKAAEALEQVAQEAERLAAQREENARQQAQIDAQRAELDRRDAEARERDRAAQEAARAAREAEIVVAEQSMRAAHEAENRVRAAAPAMHDCLRQWKAACDADDNDELANARRERDRILTDLRVADAQGAA